MEGATYLWKATGGTITAGADASQVTFTAGPGAAVLLRCEVNVPGRGPLVGVGTVHLRETDPE